VLSVSIHETDSTVVLLVATVSSIHKIVLQHPSRLFDNNDGLAADISNLSIFGKVNNSVVQSPETYRLLDQHHAMPSKNNDPNSESL